MESSSQPVIKIREQQDRRSPGHAPQPLPLSDDNTKTGLITPASRTAFILMCHIDPGRDKYGKQPQSLWRLLLLSWMATFLIGEYTLDDIAKSSRTGMQRGGMSSDH